MTLKEIRKSRHLTLAKASRGIGISLSALSKIENGIYPMSKEVEKKICNYYNIEVFQKAMAPSELAEYYKKLSDNFEAIVEIQRKTISNLEDKLNSLKDVIQCVDYGPEYRNRYAINIKTEKDIRIIYPVVKEVYETWEKILKDLK